MSQQKRYAYLIGANGPEIGGKYLKYAEKDVKLMASALKGPSSRCQFTSAEPIIADERQGVLSGLNQYVKQCSPEDVLIVHFSGHAIFDETLYLICNHTDVNDVVSSAISIQDVKRYLHRCQARYKALILDCCHSGAAMPGIYKKDGLTVREQLHETLQGSGSVIIAACSQREKARELEILDGGAGFLSWAIRMACTDDFDKASIDKQSLSLAEVWRWILTLLKQVNDTLNVQERLPDPMREFLQVGTSDEIWLTHPPLVSHAPSIPKNDELRKQYLEKICTRYHAITLPIGPAEGLSLQAIFQPLALRRDPLTVQDLENRQRRALLGEEREDRDKWSEQHKKGVPSTKEQPVVAEHGEDALRQSSKGRLVILGGPGTGKTTTLKHLIGHQARRALDDPTVHVPMFLSLADLARSGKTLQSYLLDQVEELGIERSYADVLWNEIKQGHAFVALDSLDEVAPEQRPRMIDLVNSFASEYGNIWIIGSRFTEYKGGQFKQGQFSEWELLSIDATRRRELATKLLPAIATLLSPLATSSPSPMAFVTRVEEHPHAAAWGDNPLLFSLAAVVFVKTGGLPASRATLYHNVIEAVLTLREQDSIRRTNLLRMLAGLALWLQQGKGRTFTNNDLLTFLEEIQKISWEEAEHIAKRMVTSGILDVVAHDTYGFRHQTFQEYLAAVEVARQLASQDAQRREETWQFIWKKRTYSRWTEVQRLMVGVLAQLPGDKGRGVAFRWIQALLSQGETEEGDPGELGLVLALKSVVEATEIPEWKLVKTVQLERQVVMLWWHELLSAVRNGRKTKAERLEGLVHDVKYLQLCDREAIFKPIILALRDFDEQVRYTTSNVLRELSGWVSIHALLPLLEDTSESVRQAAIEVVGAQGERVPLDALLPLLEDTSESVRQAAIEVVGAQGERVPLDALLPLLEDTSESVRQAAIEVVGAQGERVPLDALLPLLQDKDWNVKQAAVQVLGAQGERVPLDALLPLLEDTSESVRQAAVQVLGAQGERVPLDALLPLLEDTSESVRQAAIEVLRARGGRVPLDALLPLLQDKDWNVRWAAVQVLGAQEGRMPLDALLPLLQDKDWNVRWAAVQVLGAQGGRVPLDALLPLLEDTSESVRQAAIEVVGAQGERVPLDALLPLLEDTSEYVRWATVQVVGAQGERVPLDALLPLLQDKDENVRWATVQVVGAQGERVPLDALLPLLQDKDEMVRQAAVQALGAQGERVPLDALLPLLENKDEDVRQAAIEVVGAQGERVPLDALLPLLQDKDEMVRQAAIEVVGAQGERISFEQLTRTLWKPYWKVRQAAIEVVGAQGERVPLDALLPLLQDKDERVRQAAIEVVGAQGERVPLDALLPLLQDKDWKVRQAAVQVLGVQGERVPLDALLPLLQDKDEDVRQAAVQVLGVQGERVPLDALLPLLQDKDWKVRQAAVQVLGVQGERVPLDALLPLLQDKDEDVRQAAVQVLGVQGERVPLDALLPLLQDKDERVRQAAVQALGAQGERVPLDALLPLLQDKDEDVRQAAVQVLGAQRERVPLDALLSLLEDTSESVRQAAVQALGAQGEHVPLDALLPLLQDKDWKVRQAAVQALGAQGEHVPLDALLPLLQDKDWKVRQAAVQALGAQGEHVPLDALLPLLQDKDWKVRQAVVKELGMQMPVKNVLDALKDENAEVWEEALSILKDVAPNTLSNLFSQATATLQGELIGELFISIQQLFIAETLGDLGLRIPIQQEKLAELLTWPFWQVRLKTVEAVGKIRRYIPDVAIRLLYDLRRNDPVRAVRDAADDALAEILSLETGIEDD